MAKTLKTMALLEQPFIKDTDKTVATVIKEAVSGLGEKIQVRRFERCVRGCTWRSIINPVLDHKYFSALVSSLQVPCVADVQRLILRP